MKTFRSDRYAIASPVRLAVVLFLLLALVTGLVLYPLYREQRGTFWAVDYTATSATRAWSFQTQGEIDGSATIAPDGSVYFGSNDKRVRIVMAASTNIGIRLRRALAPSRRHT